jgi:hypothetical protein
MDVTSSRSEPRQRPPGRPEAFDPIRVGKDRDVIAIVSLLVVVLVGLIITRVATVALRLTGLSQQSARFQARSAFTGSGFTTAESEAVVNHPVRRRIISTLMLMGSAGIVSVIGTLLIGFVGVHSGGQRLINVAILAGGLLVIFFLAKSKPVDRWMSTAIERVLRRHTRVDVRDYQSLLHLAGEWRVVELGVDSGDWITDRPLRDLDLPHQGVLVLGIQRGDGTYLGAPTGDTCLHESDTVLLYGREAVLADIDARPKGRSGEAARRRTAAEHRRLVAEEREHDPEDGPADRSADSRRRPAQPAKR